MIDTAEHLHPGSAAGDEVTVYARSRPGTTWHADPGCAQLGAAATVAFQGPAATMATWVQQEWAGSRPCATCARDVLLDVAAGSAADPAAAWAVLSCPQPKARNHRGCPREAALAAFAARHHLPTLVVDGGYRLVAARMTYDLFWATRVTFLAQPVPAEIRHVTGQTLAVAWRLLPEPERARWVRYPGYWDRALAAYRAADARHLDLRAADLILAPPA